MKTYREAIDTAKQILSASKCEKDPEFGYLYMLSGRLDYHGLNEDMAQRIISETISEKSINWFDEDQTEGDIEINGKRITVYFTESQAIVDLSPEAKEVYNNLVDEGFDDDQIKDAMEDGEYLGKAGISQNVCEEIHTALTKKG